MKQKKPEYIDLLALLRYLWKRVLIILFVTIAAGAIVCLYSVFLTTPMYTAEILMYVTNRTDSSDSISNSDLTAAQSLVETYGVILTADPTMEEVLEISGANYSAEQLRNMVSSGAVGSTEVLSVTVTDADPAEAAGIANAIAEVLPEKISEHIQGSSVSVVSYAKVPQSPSSPNVKSNTLRGCFLGLLIICGYFVIRYLMNTKINDEEYLMQTYKLPILASIPDLNRKSSRSGYYASSETKESGRRATQK